MDVFPGGWTIFDPVPVLTSTCNDSFDNTSNQSIEMHSSEWTGFLKSIEHENSTTGSGLGFSDFENTSQCRPCAMTSIPGSHLTLPYSNIPSTTSSMISPPQSATHPGCTWPATNGSTLTYPAALQAQPWRPAELPDQHPSRNPGLEVFRFQVPPTPMSAGFHQRANLEQTLLPDSPYGYDEDDVAMRGGNELMYHSDNRSTILLEECAGNDGDDEADASDPCYAQLLYRCLKETPDHTMSLKELYEWIARHSQKAKDPKSRGWQNSVRHNLSMNAAFEKAPASAQYGAKKGSLWRLTEKALREGVISTTRYRKDPKRKHERRGGIPALKRQLSGARGGQATKAATRRNREMHQARSAPYPWATQRQHRYNHVDSGFASPYSFHSGIASPMSNMLPTPGPASPFFFRQETDDYLPQLPSNPHTPPQLQLQYDTLAKPALERFELQHIDYPKDSLFGDCDDFAAETPSLATETSFMSDDGMDNLMSPVASREATIF